MRRLMWATAALASLALGGCFGDDSTSFYNAPKPVDKMSQDELCSFYAHYRDNPQLSAQGKEIATKQMRAKGCAA